MRQSCRVSPWLTRSMRSESSRRRSLGSGAGSCRGRAVSSLRSSAASSETAPSCASSRSISSDRLSTRSRRSVSAWKRSATARSWSARSCESRPSAASCSESRPTCSSNASSRAADRRRRLRFGFARAWVGLAGGLIDRRSQCAVERALEALAFLGVRVRLPVLGERAREIDAAQAALLDEDLPDAAARRALHVEGALELGAGDEPELDEDLADRPPGIVRSGAHVGHRLELPRVAVAAVHPRGIGTEAVEVQRNRACTPFQSSPGWTTPFS